MNILYIEHYAGSPQMGMEFRPYYLAREWVKKGHSVIIIAADYSHLRIKNPQVNIDFCEQIIDDITYVWVKAGEYKNNGVARAMSMFRFVGKIFEKAKWIVNKWSPDVIITSSTYPLDTYCGQRIRKYSGALLIHEVHDMWPIALIEEDGMSRYNPFIVLMQMAENSFCRNADYIVSLPCAAKQYFIEHGMKPEKFVSIMNGIVIDEWTNPTELPTEHRLLLDQLHAEKKFIICFFGSINMPYALDYLIHAKKKLNNKRIAIVLVGEGTQKEELIKEKVNDVFFLPKIPKTAIPTLVKNIDCCYVGGVHNAVYQYGVCMNKLFDSMMSGRPILYALEAPNNIIRDYHCGISVRAESVEELAEGMKRMLNLSETERKQMGQNGRNAVLQHFTYEKLACQFETLFYKGRTVS